MVAIQHTHTVAFIQPNRGNRAFRAGDFIMHVIFDDECGKLIGNWFGFLYIIMQCLLQSFSWILIDFDWLRAIILTAAPSQPQQPMCQ